MLVKTRGIVFRTVKYSETSVIADIYTEELGLQSYIINGIRSKKSKVSAGLVQLMSLVDLVVYHRPDKELNRIKEIKSAYLFQDIPFNLTKGAVGLFLIEVMQKTIKEREKNEDLFEFLFYVFQYLDETPFSVRNYHLAVLVDLTSHLGFYPAGKLKDDVPFFDMKEGLFVNQKPLHYYHLSRSQSILFDELLRTDTEVVHELAIPNEDRTILLDKIIQYFRLHVDNMKEINAHKILKTVLS